MWLVFAVLSAVFAALTAVFSKIGVKEVNSSLATAIRTMVVVLVSWGMVWITKVQFSLSSVSLKSWLFLLLSGLSTGLSWLCYYKALQMGETGKVLAIDKLSIVFAVIFAAVFLSEKITLKSGIAVCLIIAGAIMMSI